MGNEASRGLSPGGALPPSPRTPNGVAGLRRAKSFSNDVPSPSTGSTATTQIDRSIQRMDKTIRKRVRGGITYNMKIILRGDRGTGKTSLFQRLKGEPIPASHETTPQLQSATINWSFRANSEESVKCDVWDVVDKGFVPATDATPNPNGAAEANPFEAAAAASAQGNGAHMVATVDATTVDVYHETHGVVFLLDVTKPHTLEYVRQHLDQVPVHIPTLVLGNFRDCGAQRKIFKEDIQELLYGGAVAHHQPVRRPHELLYFECSLLNCYGLKSLHQYFGIPFLQLKQQTIRQQLRILEGEFTHLKHDLQAKISEQKYADYLEHIKASGSDIRTGRRAAAAAAAAAANARAANDAPSSSAQQLEEDSPTSKTRLDRTMSSSSDIVVHSETTPSSSVELPVAPTQQAARQVDLEDLPERTAALAQAGNSLKIDYTQEERRAARRPLEMPPLPGMHPILNSSEQKEEVDDVEDKATAKENGQQKPRKKVTSAPTAKPVTTQESDAPMNLEDFQVPKPRVNDLDSFYSDDDSEEEADDDDEVVISTASARLAKAASAKYHKQKFLDSDDSDSDSEKRATQRKAPTAPSSKQHSPRRYLTKPSTDDSATAVDASAATSVGVVPSPPSPVRPPLANGSPRSPVSPPRPTVSPQHSPRRRVKEIQSSSSNEHHSGERPVAVGGVITSLALMEQEQAPTVAVTDEVTAYEGQMVAPACTSTANDSLVVSGMDIEEQDTIENVPQIDSIEEVSPDIDDEKRDDSAVDCRQDVVEVVELNSALAGVIENSFDGAESNSNVLSTDVLAPAVVEDDVDEAELVVQAAAGDIDSLLSEEKNQEDKDKLNVDDQTSVIVGTRDAAQDDEASEQPSTSSANPSMEVAANVHNHDGSGSDDDVQVPRSSGIVSQLKQQQHSVELTLIDDDSDEAADGSSPNTTSIPLPTTMTQSSTWGRKVEILLSDAEDSDAPPATSKPAEAPRPAPRPQSPMDLTSIPSPPLAPAVANDSGNLGDILESFLNDSGSDSDDAAPNVAASQTATRVVEESHDEDDVENDRFAAYDMKRSTHRRSKTSRRQHFEDLANDGNTTTSLSSSQTSSFSTTSESTTRPSSIANQDVLAAIRAAELDALKMLEASTPLPSRANAVESGDHTEETVKKKKKSSSRSSSRKADKGEDNDGDDASAKKKKSKKKKDKEGGSSSRTKRREVILTDEDE